MAQELRSNDSRIRLQLLLGHHSIAAAGAAFLTLGFSGFGRFWEARVRLG